MAIIGKVYPAKMRVPVVDPFIIVGHHKDNYPKGKEDMSPSETPTNWIVGQDFDSGRGYNMYHGSHLPGFPSHPHRGFETITYARTGFIDHFDSLGNFGRYGDGDVQWMTSGRGMQHAEMFPLLDMKNDNPFEIVQIWLNLPAKYKMVEPIYKMIWKESIPIISLDENSQKNTVKVIMGKYQQAEAHPINNNSWAIDPNNYVNIWEVNIEKGKKFTMPYFPDNIKTQLYVMKGEILAEGNKIGEQQLLIYTSDSDTTIEATLDSTFMVFVGREIGEPVVAYGPFVMNTQEEISQAYRDFRITQFGGWPWDGNAPTIDRLRGRFSRYDNGTKEELPPK